MPLRDHELLDHLARSYGIAPEYYDNFGRCHVATADTKRAILKAMGVRAETAEDLEREAAALEVAQWRSVCDPVLVIGAAKGVTTWSVRLPLTQDQDSALRIAWEVQDEEGVCRQTGEAGPGMVAKEETVIEGSRYARFELPLPASLPFGHYIVQARGELAGVVGEGRLALIVAPAQCYVPEALLQGAHYWGLSVQLYALRSARNWGIGDFGDLWELIRWAPQELGLGLIGLNPLHSLKNRHPFHVSPYAPDSRFFLNAIYLDIERIPEYRASAAAQRLVEDPAVRANLERLRARDTVDYGEVWGLKRKVLREVFDTFLEQHYPEAAGQRQAQSERGQAFARFLDEEGEQLTCYATFQALSERFEQADPPTWVWWEWPTSLKNPHSAEIAAFRRLHPREILFYAYVQWLAEQQLEQVAERARESGMPVGLYLDLALGSERAGSDAWIYAGQFAMEAEAGAPPDAFNSGGQNWGLPPMCPHRLRADGYRMFIQLVRRSMRHAGALRIDHVMALFRLFWVPRGLPPSAGAYVAYPAEDLLGILALESVRCRTVVIGEDLGTVPDFVREALAAARILSYRVAYFEREADQRFKPSGSYPSQAVAVVNTPDLPTLAGFWSGQDITVRQELGIAPDDRARLDGLNQRQVDKRQLVRALVAEHLWPPGVAQARALDSALSTDLCMAIHAFLARTPSWIVLASLEDVLTDVDQANLPGTLNEHPNWVRKRGPLLSDLRRDARLHRVAVTMRLHRPAGWRRERQDPSRAEEREG